MSSAYGRRRGRMESARSARGTARAGVLAWLEKALSSAAVRGPGSNTTPSLQFSPQTFGTLDGML